MASLKPKECEDVKEASTLPVFERQPVRDIPIMDLHGWHIIEN